MEINEEQEARAELMRKNEDGDVEYEESKILITSLMYFDTGFGVDILIDVDKEEVVVVNHLTKRSFTSQGLQRNENR